MVQDGSFGFMRIGKSITAGWAFPLMAALCLFGAGCASQKNVAKVKDTFFDDFLKEQIGGDHIGAFEMDAVSADLAVRPPLTVPVEANPVAENIPQLKEPIKVTVAPRIVASKPRTQPRKVVAAPARNADHLPRQIVTIKPKPKVADSAEVLPKTKPGEAVAEILPLEKDVESEAYLFDLPDLPADDLPGKPGSEGADMAVAKSVTIQPDTVLWITVEEDPSLNGKYLVNEYSAIDFGYVGLVLLNDMAIEDAAKKLKQNLEVRYLKKATVSVKLAKASYDRIGVTGAVLNPGMLKIGPGSTISLNDALRRAGGLRLEATDARIKFIKGGLLSPFGPIAEGTIFPLVNDEGRPTIPQISLVNNDLIYVYPHQTSAVSLGEKRILLLGEVSRQGFVQFAGNEPCTLLHLLFKIGGLTKYAKKDAIRIVRRDKNGKETEIQADAKTLLREGNPDDDIVLENGDRVIVPTRGITWL